MDGGLIQIAFTICFAVTAVLVGLLIYRALLGIHEEDQIFLDRVEAALELENATTVRRIESLNRWVTRVWWAFGFSVLWLVGMAVYWALFGYDQLVF